MSQETLNAPEERGAGELFNVDGELHILDMELAPVRVTGQVADTQLLSESSEITLTPGDLPNVTTTVKTTIGVALANVLFLTHAFNDKIPYLTGELTYKKIEGIIIDGINSKLITVPELKVFLRAASWSTGIMPLFVASTSPQSVVGNPKTRGLRNKFIKDNKDTIDTPLTLAKLDTLVSDLEKEHIKGDVTETFYKSNKSYDVTRKRMYGVFGGETRLDDPTKMDLVTNSLEEGWDVEQLTPMFNALRMGSYYRGAETALGGADFKDLIRMFQNYKIVNGDCGVSFGKSVLVTEENIPLLDGRYDLTATAVSGKDLQNQVGKRVMLRSPLTCQQAGQAYCSTCCGDNLSRSPTTLGMLAANLGAAFLSLFLAAMHGRSLQVAPLDLDATIR